MRAPQSRFTPDKRQAHSKLSYLCHDPNHSPHAIFDRLQSHCRSLRCPEHVNTCHTPPEVPRAREHVSYTT